MKSRMKKILVFIICLTIFSNKVYANAYDIFFKTNAGNTLKNGDIVEFNTGIGCVSSEAAISDEKFTVIYDKEIFEMLSYSGDSVFKIRNGWEYLTMGGGMGSYSIEMTAKTSKDYITEEIATGYCDDSTNATLISFKLKVKNASNQDTKVQVIDQADYVEEIKFSIHNNASNNDLSSLKVEDYKLDSEFNKNRTDYETTVPYEIEKINITATAEDSNAKVSGTGEHELETGDNKIEIEVTAENGSKKKYTINVIRKDANDDTTVSKVDVTDSNKEKVSLAYDKKTKTYTAQVSKDITFITFDIKCSGDECEVESPIAEALKEGKNTFKFKVISQNGDKEEYKIIINKEAEKKSHTVLILTIALIISIIGCITLLILYLRSRKR